ncbi:MAG: AIPR family protein, partial [Lachnospiraceae bacterium]|nr:AIPR family protein [Lachnospiraceae bacterium]
MKLEEYAEELINNLRADAAINGTDAGDEFYNQTLDMLKENGEFDDPVLHWFSKSGRRNRLMQIDGYAFDETDKSLVLMIYDFEDSVSPSNLVNTQIETLYKRLLAFLDEACNGNIEEYCDDSDDTIMLARLIKKRMNAEEISSELLLKVKFYIITNKILSSKVKRLKQEDFNGKPVEVNLWHLERFYEIEQAANNEPIYIDLKNEFNSNGIPCIEGRVGENLGYKAYIAIIPGKLLADIYIAYGSKVLEGNVRAFLGTAGAKSVNSGIKRTIINEPTRFFTYNNGIATTAASIELEKIDGQLYVTAIEDLQIINGGQTTASLAEAVLKKNNVELEGIFVPMKLTVIEDRESVNEDGVRFYDSMVEKIARYANSQNKVTAADFFSNSPFHILMEQLSKKYLAPPVNGSPNPSGWYYERTKKKYNQEQMKMSKAEKDRFAIKFPKKQIIKKEDLAKYLYAIECKPDLVAKGRNWVIKDFGSAINEIYKKDKAQFNEYYFKKCVAATILYRTTDAYLEKLKRIPGAWYTVGGYKMNIVPYSIAKIVSCIPKGYSIDWMKIWNDQEVYPSLMAEIERITQITNDFICDSHGVIVTEYCKKKETWEAYRKIPYSLSKEFLDSLISDEYETEQAASAKSSQKTTNQVKDAMKIVEKGSNYWKNLLAEAAKVNMLSFKEISLLKVAIDIETTGKLPSPAQTKAIYQIEKKINDAGI